MTVQSAFVFASFPFLFVCCLILILRLYTRIFVIRNPGLEDIFVTLACLFATGLFGIGCKLIQYSGFGKHINELNSAELETLGTFIQLYLAAILLYILSLSCVKISVFLQYLRLFPTGPTRWASYAGIILIIANLIWGLLASLLFCNPLHGFWDASDGGDCSRRATAYLSFAGANIATSCIVVLVPMPALLKLKLATRTRAAMCCVFGLGIIDIILASLRISSLRQLAITSDLTYYLKPLGIWSSLESTVAIICASTPILRPFLAKWIPGLVTTRCSTPNAPLRGRPVSVSGKYQTAVPPPRNAAEVDVEVGSECRHGVGMHVQKISSGNSRDDKGTSPAEEPVTSNARVQRWVSVPIESIVWPKEGHARWI